MSACSHPKAWRIIGRDQPFDVETEDEETERYHRLHTDRFPFYRVHDRPRFERDYTTRQLSC